MNNQQFVQVVSLFSWRAGNQLLAEYSRIACGRFERRPCRHFAGCSDRAPQMMESQI